MLQDILTLIIVLVWVIIGPINSVVVMIDERMYGSSIWSISVMSGSPEGLCTSVTLPFLSYTL